MYRRQKLYIIRRYAFSPLTLSTSINPYVAFTQWKQLCLKLTRFKSIIVSLPCKIWRLYGLFYRWFENQYWVPPKIEQHIVLTFLRSLFTQSVVFIRYLNSSKNYSLLLLDTFMHIRLKQRKLVICFTTRYTYFKIPR